jgi:hypothetical protein
LLYIIHIEKMLVGRPHGGATSRHKRLQKAGAFRLFEKA